METGQRGMDCRAIAQRRDMSWFSIPFHSMSIGGLVGEGSKD